MNRVMAGLQKFHSEIAPNKQELFRALAKGQEPEILLITCSDSRIVPGLMLHSDPGLIFTIRNAGNIVPRHGAAGGGEGATIEYAVRALNIPHIVICGHTCCGAMQGLLDRSAVESLSLVDQWLNHAQPSLDAARSKHPGDRINVDVLARENVLMQMANLKTYPFIADALAEGDLTLHGWVFEIATARILRHDPHCDDFVEFDAGYGAEESRV